MNTNVSFEYLTSFELSLLLAGYKVEHALYKVIGDNSIITRCLATTIQLIETELSVRAIEANV